MCTATSLTPEPTAATPAEVVILIYCALDVTEKDPALQQPFKDSDLPNEDRKKG